MQAPRGASVVAALTDTMATFWVVPSITYLWRVDVHNPNMIIATADGDVPVTAIGTALVYLLTGHDWSCYEVSNVIVLPNCSDVLYSTRVMHRLFGFSHDPESGTIHVPGAPDIAIHDDGAAYTTPVAFVKSGASRPPGTHIPPRRPSALCAPLSAGSALPAAVTEAIGTPQAILFQRLAFPYAEQWRLVPSASTGHGLHPSTRVAVDLPLRDVVIRGRARTLPFYRSPASAQPPPGAVIYMDFAGPLLESYPNRFVVYCGCSCAGSGYFRLFPGHGMTGALATAALEATIADIGAKLGLMTQYKPCVVRTDQGRGFIGREFREFLTERQIQLSLACTYTPQQNSHVERAWGIVFGTARVLLAASQLPPSLHPFALQTAVWITNRLPRPSRGQKSPFELLSRALPDLQYLYTFGCLCSVTIPTANREGDRHFADRGLIGLYLGPSEVSPGSVVLTNAPNKRVIVSRQIRVWEDQFPGLDGTRTPWLIDPVATDSSATPASSEPTLSQPPPPSANSPAAPPAPDVVPVPPVTPVPPPPSQPPATVPPPPPRRLPPSPQQPLPPPSPASELTYDRHPSADDPSSRHYERSHPRRQRNHTERLNVNSTRGQAYGAVAEVLLLDPPARSLSAVVSSALAVYGVQHSAEQLSRCCLASIDSCRWYDDRCSACGVVCLEPIRRVLKTHVPVTAWASTCVDVSEAFATFDNTQATALLACTFTAGHAHAVTLTKDMGDLTVPRGIRQVINSPQASYWLEAISLELRGLISNNTWTLIRRSAMPAGANIMNCHFVFTVKRKADGSIEKFKARLVADGNTQKHGIDFDRIFATVVKTLTIRLVLAIAAARDYNLTSIDIRQAYLQGELKERLFMRVPPYLPHEHRPPDSDTWVCELNRSLYGLKQAGRVWANLFAAFLTEWGMHRSTIDTCLYVYTRGNLILWVLIYVDDAVICDNCPTLRDRFVSDLSKRFPTEDKPPPTRHGPHDAAETQWGRGTKRATGG